MIFLKNLNLTQSTLEEFALNYFAKTNYLEKKEVLKGDVLIISTSQILFLHKKWRESGIINLDLEL